MRIILILIMTFLMISAPVSAVDKHRPAGLSVYNEELLGLINHHRTNNHLNPLLLDRRLTTLAHNHSAYMHQKGDLNHDGFDERFKSSGSMNCVENVGWNSKTAREQFVAWQRSNGHDRNMLANDVRRAGISKIGAFVTFLACK